MPELETLLSRTAALHNHLCPRQVLGVRMGMYAAELLGLSLPQEDKRLYTFVETDGCFADGVAAATGCTLGHRTLRLMDYGKVAATFADTKTGEAVRIWPSAAARAIAAERVPAAPSRWHAQLTAYQDIPSADLFCKSAVVLTVDLQALIGRPGSRVSCAACGEEILNQRGLTVAGSVVCRTCAGESYWQPGAGEGRQQAAPESRDEQPAPEPASRD